MLAEQVAASLVARAQELLDARVFLDAKQLAVEALVKSRSGAAADHARYIIHTVNAQLGIPEDLPAPPRQPLPPLPPPIPERAPAERPVPPAEGHADDWRTAASIHGALYVGLIGATIGGFASPDRPADGAVPVGIAVGIGAGVYLPKVLDKLHWNEGQIRTAGSGSVWGGMIGGLIADVANLEGTSPTDVLLGASIGATVGMLGGGAFARLNKLTPGDLALTDTFAGMGAAGGLTIGMLMQPPRTEAYSLNAALGIAGGVAVGLIAAPQTNTTPRRMARVAGLAAAGGALPFLLYAGISDPSSSSDEQLTGALSTAGLIVGAYIGFRLTEHMDEGLDVIDGKQHVDDAPAALLGRSSAGHWSLGAPALGPLSRALAPQTGMALQILGARF